MKTRTYAANRKPRIAVVAAALVLAVVAAFVLLMSGGATGDRVADGYPAKDVAQIEPANDGDTGAESRWTPPVTDDPTVLARWLAKLIYGMDHREDRDEYVDAVTATTLGALADDPDAIGDLTGENPGLAPAAQLVPDQALWERLAEHDQWSSFDVREPVGTQIVDAGDELTEAGVTATKVLVVGTRTVHYTDEEGASQAHVEQPALGALIACAPDLGGCRLVSVIEH